MYDTCTLVPLFRSLSQWNATLPTNTIYFPVNFRLPLLGQWRLKRHLPPTLQSRHLLLASSFNHFKLKDMCVKRHLQGQKTNKYMVQQGGEGYMEVHISSPPTFPYTYLQTKRKCTNKIHAAQHFRPYNKVDRAL